MATETPCEVQTVNVTNPSLTVSNPQQLSKVERAIRQRMRTEQKKREEKWEDIARVRRNDILFLPTDGRVIVCRVQAKKSEYDLDVYVCTNGARTFFVLESEIGSHQHYRDGVRVLDICRAATGQMGSFYY
jgi:hypothetical protein